MRNSSQILRDTCPEIPAAGLIVSGGGSVSSCLTVETEIKNPDGRQFSDDSRYPLGLPSISPEKAADPKEYIDITHGILTECSENASPLINPNPDGYFRNCLIEEYEKQNYKTAQRKPLGQPVEWKIPPNVDPLKNTFGVPNKPGPSVYELLNPPLAKGDKNPSWLPSNPSFTKCANEVGTISINRKYNNHFQPKSTFGLEVPCFPDGKACKDVMNCSSILERTYIVPKELKDFQEKFEHKLGTSLDPNKRTRDHLPSDFSFGFFQKSDSNMAEILQEYFRSRERNRTILSDIYLKFKEANFLEFDYFLKLCQYHDKAQIGLISTANLKEVFSDLFFEVNWSQLKEMISSCHLWSSNENCDNLFQDSKLEKQSAPNLLKPASSVPVIKCGHQVPHCEICNDIGNNTYQFLGRTKVEPKVEILSDLTANDRICSKIGDIPQTNLIQALTDDFINSPTSGEINNEFGKINTHEWRRFGLRSTRNDLVAPKLKKLSNKRNYGDEMDSYTVLWPSFYTVRGLSLRELVEPCNRDEILKIFTNLGVTFIGDSFHNLWEKAVAESPDGKVNVETFHQLLREVVSSKFFDAL